MIEMDNNENETDLCLATSMDDLWTVHVTAFSSSVSSKQFQLRCAVVRFFSPTHQLLLNRKYSVGESMGK